MRYRGLACAIVVALVSIPGVAGAQSAPLPPVSEPAATARPWSYALGGLGLLGLGLGAYWGLDAISQQRDADRLCPVRRCGDPRGVELSRRALQSGDRATVATALGLAASGFSVLLYLSADDPAPRRLLSVGSWLGPESAGAHARLMF